MMVWAFGRDSVAESVIAARVVVASFGMVGSGNEKTPENARFSGAWVRVDEGARTLDIRNHNPTL